MRRLLFECTEMSNTMPIKLQSLKIVLLTYQLSTGNERRYVARVHYICARARNEQVRRHSALVQQISASFRLISHFSPRFLCRYCTHYNTPMHQNKNKKIRFYYLSVLTVVASHPCTCSGACSRIHAPQTVQDCE